MVCRAAFLAAGLAVIGCAANPQVTTATQPPSPAVLALRDDLSRIFNAPLNERGVWAVDVRSLDTGERLFQLNTGKLMMPASNMKILTLATAANTLGWDYRFTTTLEARGPIAGGTLHGDLIVKSNGDPTINSRYGRADSVLTQWAQALADAGIRAIDGRVIGNDQAFDDEGIGAGWAWDYLQYGYAAPVGALEFNESVAALTIAPAAPAGATAIVSLQAGAGLALLNRTTTGGAGSDDTVDYRRHIDRPVLEVTGSIPLGAQPDVRTVAVVNPTLFFAESLRSGLIARGIDITGPAVDYDDVAAELLAADSGTDRSTVLPATIIATTDSPPLREIATVLMKVSQNLYAETLLKAAGAARGGLGTVEGGRIAARDSLAAWGVSPDMYVMYDGSGLSRYNYVTASALTSILERFYKDPVHHDAFLATLPIAGKDGTLASRLRLTRAEGNALAKTGSIANVRSLSGFVKTRDGEMLVFSMMANDFVIPAASITWIADLGVEILSNFSRK